MFNKEYIIKNKGEIGILLSSLCFSFIPILVKLISGTLNGFFISFGRFFFGIIFVYIALKISKKSFKIYDKFYLVLRGFLGALSMVLLYIAIEITSSGRATLLSSTYPIFAVIFGCLFFKERINILNILSMILCFGGSIFIFYDGSIYSGYGDFLALLSGIIGGLAVNYMKKSREKNNSYIIYLSVCVFGVLNSIFSINQVSKLDSTLFLILFIIGLFTFFGQVLFGFSFKYVSTVKGGILSYSSIPLTLMLSYFFVGEEFKLKFFLGIFFIISGLILNSIPHKNKNEV